MTREFLRLIVIGLALFTSGCQFPWLQRPVAESFPVAFPTPPTREQVIGAVNANFARISQLQSDVSISVQGLPSLKGSLALERPRRFRLRAGLMGLPGTGLDLGSNDEQFWMWLEQSRPPGVYFSRHDQFARSAARQFIPIEPSWLIDALGVVQFDPAATHEGPYQRVAGKIEIHSRIPSATGDMTKITVIHEQYGWVLEQYIFDSRGKRIASARASKHQFYATEGVTLPQHIEIQLAQGESSQMSFRIDVGSYQINQLTGDAAQLWTMPRPDGYPLIDLADPRSGSLTRLPLNLGTRPTNTPQNSPRTNLRQRLRGVFR